jgi:hypothetical protein
LDRATQAPLSPPSPPSSTLASLELLSSLKPEVTMTSCLIMIYYVILIICKPFYVLTACCLTMIMA